MSEEKKPMAEKLKDFVFVHGDKAKAEAGKPADGRYRLYHITVKGESRYVWERNPVAALGRGAKEIGGVANPVGGAVDVDQVKDVFKSLSPEERMKLLKELEGEEKKGKKTA